MNKLKSISGKLSRSSLAPPCGSVLHHRPWIMWVSKCNRYLEHSKPEDGFFPSGHAGLFLVGGWGDTLQLQPCHWALGYGRTFLQILKKRNENNFNREKQK